MYQQQCDQTMYPNFQINSACARKYFVAHIPKKRVYIYQYGIYGIQTFCKIICDWYLCNILNIWYLFCKIICNKYTRYSKMHETPFNVLLVRNKLALLIAKLVTLRSEISYSSKSHNQARFSHRKWNFCCFTCHIMEYVF